MKNQTLLIEKRAIHDKFTKEINELIHTFINSTLSYLEPKKAHLYCSEIVEGIDVVINLETEISDFELFNSIMKMPLNFIIIGNSNYSYLKSALIDEIGIEAVTTFEEFVKTFAGALQFLKTKRIPYLINLAKSFSTVETLLKYFRERRRYFVTYLSLIPEFSKGTLKLSKDEFLELEISNLEYFMVQTTTGRNVLLMNSCYEDFAVTVNENFMTWNKQFNHLDELSLEPQRLTLFNVLMHRESGNMNNNFSLKPNNQMFSFLEIKSTLLSYECIFANYSLNTISAFTLIKNLIPKLEKYVVGNYRILIPKTEFENLEKMFPSLKLSLNSKNYFDHLNSFAPFSFSGEHFYYSNAMLIVRFITNTIQMKLERVKRFQVHSGFIFEDQVIQVLEKYGFKDCKITRINRKEFDLVTTKNNQIHNFQCKNNSFEISLVDINYQQTAQINNRLCKYYESAYKKEVEREHLLKTKVGIDQITHYVISKFPVMTNQNYVINFNELDDWLKKNF